MMRASALTMWSNFFFWQIKIELEDQSSPSETSTTFACTYFLNGQPVATATAPSKKKAKAMAADMALKKAFEMGILTHQAQGEFGKDDAAQDEEPNAASA